MKINLLFVLTLCLFSTFSFAQTTRYWSGNGSSGSISDPLNWNGVTIPSAGDNLYFNNTLGSNYWPFSDFGNNSYFNEIITYSGAGGISFHGNNTYANKFENFSDPNLFLLNINQEIGNRSGNNLEINPTGGEILIKGESWDFTPGGPYPQVFSTLRMDCNSNADPVLKVSGNNTLTIYSNIYETNTGGTHHASLQLVAGNPTVILKGTNTYTGLTTVGVGKLQLNDSAGNTIPITNNVTVSSAGTLQVSFNQTLHDLTLASGATLIVDHGTLTINGTFNHTGANVILSGTGAIVYGANAILSYTVSSYNTSSPNYLSKFTAKDTIANSIIYDNGTNVGIGTTTPGQYKLAVEGTIGARKIKVTQAASWADYVFNEGYELRPLSEVEKFIKTNKHLPEVPTGREVKKDGIDVGDNQALLLKKIEELTLYMIEANKKIEEMKKENQEMQKINGVVQKLLQAQIDRLKRQKAQLHLDNKKL